MGSLIKFSGAIFDLDGTILDSMSMWRTLLENSLLRHGIYPEPYLSLNIWGFSSARREEYLRNKYGLELTSDEISSGFGYYIKRFYANEAVPKPGAVDFLKFLYSRGVKIALATATPVEYMESALDKYDIKRYFDVILTTKEIGVGKSKPDIYDLSCSRLGIDKSDAVIFEDAHYAINTAKNAGYTVIAIDDCWQFRTRDSNISRADRFIESWDKVYDLIDIK